MLLSSILLVFGSMVSVVESSEAVVATADDGRSIDRNLRGRWPWHKKDDTDVSQRP